MGNLSKTIRYFKRNGYKKTYYAMMERLFPKDVPFHAEKEIYDGPIDEDIKFSVLVPVYETDEVFLREMIESVLGQIYGNFELIIGDASVSDGPENIVKSYTDERIKYIKIPENKGISANTNVILEAATGDYCCLLDHDDFITPDALYENAILISKEKKTGNEVDMIYSDEDKCDAAGEKYFEAHIKEKFNLDLFLSNNYICHFATIKTSLIKQLKFRGEYDGAQDYDLFLRVVLNSSNDRIYHIPKILYHWRCHEKSTSFNPASKEYAYDAGKRAIKDFVLKKYNADLQVEELPHKGFYKVLWGEDIFNIRKDIGAVGSVIIKGNRIVNGIYMEDGRELFLNMNKYYSGYMHRAVTTRDVVMCDIRTVIPTPSMKDDFDELMGAYNDVKKSGEISEAGLENLAQDISFEFARRLKQKGLLFLYNRDLTS